MALLLELQRAVKSIFDNEYDLNVSSTPKVVTLEKVKFNPATGKFEDVHKKNMAMKEKEFDDVMANGRKEVMSHARLMPPLNANSMIRPFSEIYTVNDWVTVEIVQTVSYGVEWADRTDLEKELLTLMGRDGVKYFAPNFVIVKLIFEGRDGYALPYARIPNLRRDSIVTVGAFVKHLSGAVPYGWWCNGLTDNGNWELCGTNVSSSSALSYIHTHPYLNDVNQGGEVLVALPAVVDRKVDLSDPKNWAGII